MGTPLIQPHHQKSHGLSHSTCHGFSLVELSIVLVILGLLTGGILAGQSLIRASELRTISNDAQRFATASHTFRDKYFALPGDITNATAFWGTGTCPRSTPVATAKTVTCNGNGDGWINHGAASGCSAGTEAGCNQERMRFWQHLANAGLIEGSYSGVDSAGAANFDEVPGENVPSGRMSNSGWSIMNEGPHLTANTEWYAMPQSNVFSIGRTAANSQPHNGLLKPEEMWNIDTKMDDGRPGTGIVFVKEDNNTCNNADTNPATATYALTTNSIQCVGFIALK